MKVIPGKCRHLFTLCTRPFRPFNYHAINTRYRIFFWGGIENSLFKFPRVKLQRYGKCLFSFLSLRKAVNQKSFQEPALRTRGPTASLPLIIQVRQVANQGTVPDLGALGYEETEGKGNFQGSLVFACQLYCYANQHLLTLLLV